MAARTWLIAGVSSGFGRELSTQLLDHGDHVVGTIREPSKVTDLIPIVRYEILVEATSMTTGRPGSTVSMSAATPTSGRLGSPARSPIRRHSMDCSPRSATSASRCLRCVAPDVTDAER